MGINIKNAKKPKGLGGKKMCRRMNEGHHKELAEWGLADISISDGSTVADIGCGGGGNVARMRNMFTGGKVIGVDYSKTSVKVAKKFNADAIRAGTCEIVEGNVSSLPFESESFDLITAFETVYFWRDLSLAFKNIYSALKTGGAFFICNEADGLHESDRKWVDVIGDMEIYTGAELCAYLNEAGFTDVKTQSVDDRHWLKVLAVKTLQNIGKQ